MSDLVANISSSTNSPSAQFQVDFIVYLQRLLIEGEFSATYKFGLLHALADLCIEKQEGDNSRILLDDLATKFAELYWGHSLPYSETSESPCVLFQNNGAQAKVLTQLRDVRDLNLHSFSRVKKSDQWRTILASAKSTLKTGPLWRLQKLQGKDECFFYPHIKGQKFIELNPGIVACFQRFYDLVVSLSRNHWLEKIRSIKSNHKLIGEGDLDSFLFGTQRASLAKVKPVLFDIQKGQCFYCQKILQQSTSQVDHFIPWARYPHDLGHNFVLAHAICNNHKSDHLAAHVHSDRWHEQNIILNGSAISSELDAYFTCDVERSEAVATWAYRLAHQNAASLWLDKDQFIPAS